MKTQETTIVNHLRRTGSITQREALMEYSIQSLTRRITTLRNLGFDIVTEHKRHPVTEQRYARYHLKNKAIHLGYSA